MLLSRRVTSPCGKLMWGFVNATGRRQYRCASKGVARVSEHQEDCRCHQVHASDLEDLVWSAVANALSDPELLLAFAEDQAELAAASRR